MRVRVVRVVNGGCVVYMFELRHFSGICQLWVKFYQTAWRTLSYPIRAKTSAYGFSVLIVPSLAA